MSVQTEAPVTRRRPLAAFLYVGGLVVVMAAILVAIALWPKPAEPLQQPNSTEVAWLACKTTANEHPGSVLAIGDPSSTMPVTVTEWGKYVSVTKSTPQSSAMSLTVDDSSFDLTLNDTGLQLCGFKVTVGTSPGNARYEYYSASGPKVHFQAPPGENMLFVGAFAVPTT